MVKTMEREHRNIEYKQDASSKTYLKTVSAYANYGTGQIIFGITDELEVIGLADPEQTVLNLENQINDSISPHPHFTFTINKTNRTATLTVYEGQDKPYTYNGRAYQRNDSASIPVDNAELKRLALQGLNLNYEDLPAKPQPTTFLILEEAMKDRANVQHLSTDVKRTLNLYNDDGQFNNAGALLADQNSFPGIDITRFGKTNEIILDRRRLEHQSIITQLKEAMATFEQYYQYETIRGLTRESQELIPTIAFRETIANALVHRDWSRHQQIQVSMYPDRIEVTSPGGLPKNQIPELYLRGENSVLRNPKLAGVMYRLHYIEQFGTGIPKIKWAYETVTVQPQFDLTANVIRVILPVVNGNPAAKLTNDEITLLSAMTTTESYRREELDQLTGFNSQKTRRLLNRLITNGLVIKQGNTRNTTYRKK